MSFNWTRNGRLQINHASFSVYSFDCGAHPGLSQALNF